MVPGTRRKRITWWTRADGWRRQLECESWSAGLAWVLLQLRAEVIALAEALGVDASGHKYEIEPRIDSALLGLTGNDNADRPRSSERDAKEE